MTNFEAIKSSLENKSLQIGFILCRSHMCCSQKKVYYELTVPRMQVIVDEFLGFIGQIPEFLIETDEIWWNGHADSILRINENMNFEWYCEAEIQDDEDEATFNTILSDLLKRRKNNYRTESINGQYGLFLLHDEYFEDENERKEDFPDNPFGGYYFTEILINRVELTNNAESDNVENDFEAWLNKPASLL